MNATQGFAVQIIHRTEPVREKTSIEEIGDLIDEIRLNGKPRTGGLFFLNVNNLGATPGAIAGRAVEICENEGVQLVAPHF